MVEMQLWIKVDFVDLKNLSKPTVIEVGYHGSHSCPTGKFCTHVHIKAIFNNIVILL